MKALRVLCMRLAGLFTSRHHDEEMSEELEALVQLHADDYLRAGITPDEARRRALAKIGGIQSVKQASREQRSCLMVETTVQDIRFAARMLLRHRSYAGTAVLTLALGIATTTAMFSIVDAVMLRPFPFPEAHRLVMLWETNAARSITRFSGSAANYVDWEANTTAFAHLGAWELRRENRTDGARPEQVRGAVASAPLFRALGIAPHIGRFFHDEEDTPSGRFVAILGYDYWRREFGGDAAVLGRSIVVNGDAHTIVGVMPALRTPFKADVWRPLAADVATLDRGDHSLFVLGRLAQGRSMPSAESELQSVAATLAETFAESNRGWSVRAESIYDALVPERTRWSMLILVGAVGVLLVIACVNVASLTLARATSRARELSTRVALGAGRARLVRQLSTESALLAFVSAAAGVVAAGWLLDLVKWLFPADISGLAEASVSALATMCAVGAATVTTVAFGLLPAYQFSRRLRPADDLSLRSATASPHARRLRQSFVTAQVALALVLLVGSGLLLASVERLLNVPLGFGAAHVITARVSLNDPRYDNSAVYVGFVERLLGDLQTRANIVAAGFTSSVPFDNAYTVMQVRPPIDRDHAASEGVLSHWRVIGGDYLRAIGIPLLAGRTFTDADARGVPRVTIISTTLARQIFGDEDPVGRSILVGDARRPYRVVGIAGEARLTALDARPEPTMYFHYRQFGWPTMTIVARAADSTDAMSGLLRAAVTAADPAQPVFDERPMSAVVDAAAAAPRMSAALLATFAVLALIVAATGVYGTMSYSVAQRASEMSLRLVLGARPASVFLLALRTGLQVTALGLVIGIAVAAASANLVRDVLFEVSPWDVRVHAIASAVITVIATIACSIPARTAMRADPMTMLRQQ